MRSLGQDAQLIVLDQTVVSGVNFLTSIMLARALAPGIYGEYVLVYSILLFVKNIHLAVVTTPTMLPSVITQGTRTTNFKSEAATLHACFVGLALPALIATAILWSAAAPITVRPAVLVALCFATFGVLNQEFVRRLLFGQLSRKAAFVNDVLSYGGQLGGILALASSGKMTVESALVMIGVASTTAAIVGVRQCRFSVPYLSFNRRLMARYLHYGKWLTATHLFLWIMDRWYLYILAIYLSTTDTGVFAACLAILGAANVLFLALENHVLPIGSRILAELGPAGLRRKCRPLFLGVVVVTGLASAGIIIYSSQILRVLYGSDYQEYGHVLGLLSLFVFVGSLGRISGTALKVVSKTKQIFYGYSFAVMFTLGTAIMFVTRFGLEGAAVGHVLGNAVTTLWLAVSFLRATSRDAQRRWAPCQPEAARTVPQASTWSGQAVGPPTPGDLPRPTGGSHAGGRTW